MGPQRPIPEDRPRALDTEALRSRKAARADFDKMQRTPIAVVLDGANGTTFFDSLARVGAGGSQTISVPVSSQMPIGVLGTLQCAMFDENNTATLKFSAATQITIQ